ncbi:MAG TPA: alanine racemase, partial [Actinomycetota bacterium]|nr:alanine racemase [Actinomycetota bacterium]
MSSAGATLAELDTPALLVDLDVLEANLAEMAAVAGRAGVRLRPHTKTHKSPEIARMQVEAGAAGITCAKLGEAEVMADAGLDDLLIAYPLVGDEKLRRLRDLLEGARVRVSLDSVEVAEGLGRVGRALGRDVEVLVEVDTGLHRLGRPPGPPTAELVGLVARVPGIRVVGLLTHAGHAYRARTPDELRRLAEREVLDLVETAALCRRRGVELGEISVGSTPTARVGAFVDGVTEIRPGTYALNDATMVRLGVATEASTAAH